MKKQIAFLLLISLLVPPIVFADAVQCVQAIQQAGLTQCSSSACEQFRASEAGHKTCTASASKTPVRIVVCSNSGTSEAKYFEGNGIVAECGKLEQQDQKWDMTNCYCCCD